MPATEFADRRHCERIPLERRVTLLVESDRRNMYHDAMTIDLSQRGARVRGYIGLIPGQSIDLITGDGTPHVVLSEVVWVSRTGLTGPGEAGLRFAEAVQLPVPPLPA